MKSKQKFLFILLLSLALLTLSVGLIGPAGLAEAQGPEPPEEIQSQDEIEAMTVVPGAIPIQGRLTNAAGTPLDGAYSVRFALYDVETGGTALCNQTHSVTVAQGLFNSYLDNCYNDIEGQKLWLGITVGSDAEMTPRQVIYPVPYAVTIRPGALISGTLDGILTVYGSGGSGGTADYDAFSSYANGGGEAVTARAENGFGVYATSETNVAIEGFSHNTTENIPAILGCVNADDSVCNTYDDNNPAGMIGVSTRGDGVQGYTTDVGSRGVYATNSAGGISLAAYSDSISTTNHLYPTLYLLQGNPDGDFVVGAGALWSTRYWRVDRTGKGYFNNGTQNSGADFAEQMAVAGNEEDYEPGDVLVISTQADRQVELSSAAYSMAVIGVYSTKPAVLAGAPDTDEPLSGVPVAVIGIVPCKVSAENGAIQRGDLLVTSATPGHAMRAGPNPPQGTVLGKAMQPLTSGTGVISILVTLQ